MPFNIIQSADIRNSTRCLHDNKSGWAVYWNEDGNFEQYEEFGNVASPVVWDGKLSCVSTSGTCYIGPTQDQTAVDTSVFTLVKAKFRIELDPLAATDPPTKGKIQFQTDDDPTYDSTKEVEFSIQTDNSYREYTIDMSQEKSWQGNVVRMRVYPFIDGYEGIKVHFKSLKVESVDTFGCDTLYNGPLCSKYGAYAHPCPWVGAGGSAESSYISGGSVSIAESENDTLCVDINGYGEQAIRLRSANNVTLDSIARDIESKLSNIGIGGYAGVKVEHNYGKLKITADDTRGSDSTVVVKDTPAARTLKFFDSEGNDISTKNNGEDAASRYEPAGTIQLSNAEISKLQSAGGRLELDPNKFSVQAGREDFSLTYRDKKIDFENKTIIDFNNPVSSNGVITKVSYSGDGDSKTEFRFYRPKADGKLELLDSVNMGLPAGGLSDKVFEKSTEVRVRRGDFAAIYHGKLDAAKTEQRPNMSYFIYDGDLQETKKVVDISGRGEEGLRLFAHGEEKQTQAVLDITFDQPKLIEEIHIDAKEESRFEETNLSQVKSGGINGGPHVTGWTGTDKFGDQAPTLTNLGSLVDGVRYEQDASTEYMYPSWLDLSYTPADKFDNTPFYVKFDFAKGVPVFFDIYKVVIYFRDEDNIKFFGLQYPLTTDEADTNQYWDFVADKHNKVFMEGSEIKPKTHPYYTNPVVPTSNTFLDSHQFTLFRKLEFQFDPVRARSFRYFVNNFNRITEEFSENYSDFPLSVSPRIMEIEVYAKSDLTPNISDNFSFESSGDGDKFFTHTRKRETNNENASYLIGYPVKHVRATITPNSPLEINGVSATLSRQGGAVLKEGEGNVVSLNLPKGDSTNYDKVEFINNGEKATFYVDIADQYPIHERCLLWNRLGSEQQLSKSEIGPSPTYSRREDYYPRPTNYALNAPAYTIDPFWLLNKPCYVSYDEGVSWSSRGSILTDYMLETKITNVTSEDIAQVFILIDLGDVYALSDIKVKNESSAGNFSVAYTNIDVDDPVLLDAQHDFVGTKESVRWVRLVAPAIASEPSVKTADNGYFSASYLKASLDPLNRQNKGKLPWIKHSSLTDYSFGKAEGNCGEGYQCADEDVTTYYCVDLGRRYNLSNLIIGPTTSEFTSDVDLLSPGDLGSMFPDAETKSNDNASFSSSDVSDPNDVTWRGFGEPASQYTRWVMVKKSGGVVSEIAAHIEDNDATKKPFFAEKRWWSSKFCSLFEDESFYKEGGYSLGAVYPADKAPNLEEMEFTQSLGIDHELGRRDYLQVYIYVSDIDQLDLNRGYISLGRNETEENEGREILNVNKDRDNYFQWDFSDISSSSWKTGWNLLSLPFTENFKVGEPYFTIDDLSVRGPRSKSGKSRMRWMKVAFAGKQGCSDFQVNVDSVKIQRSKFLPAKWENGIYLKEKEYLKFPLNNFNVFSGTVEFFLSPDWTRVPDCESCDDPRERALFRIFNSDKYNLGLFLTGQGLKGYLTNGEQHLSLTGGQGGEMLKGSVHHVAFTWNFLAEDDASPVLAIYIDNKLFSTLEAEALDTVDLRHNPYATLIFGGLAWDGLIDSFSSSVGGVVDNLKVFNYAKHDFSDSLSKEGLTHTTPNSELIEISKDGVNFYGVSDRGSGIPLIFSDVEQGDPINIYVKNRGVDLAEEGQDRFSYLEILKV